MKTIILVRHAKSSWDNPDWTDFDRPLNKRGLTDAPIMASIISSHINKPDIFYSSTANRALTTAEFFADAFRINHDEIKKEINIYEKGSKHINSLISSLDDKLNSVIFFGHNPDMTSLATYFTGAYFENVPTCGVVCIDFECDSWAEVKQVNGKLRFFKTPKNSII